MSVSLPAQQAPTVDPSLFAEMRWRNIGPHRAGRTKAAAGHASQPYTFYIGMVNGGVWKTTDAGRTWKPIFDDQPTGSIGWVVVAPSDPNIVYVGSGEGLPRPDLAVGDGIYKSTDAGATWTHLGLRDAQQIPKIAVDPKNPNRLFVAALGHPYGPNEERGIFRSTNGGQSFERVLFKDANTGGKDVDIDPSNPDIVYATMWEQRQGPWENGAWEGTNGGIFKSTDGGTTWKPLTQGLPAGIVNAELAIAPSNPRRVYATLEAQTDGTGIYRSDDAGETWTRITTDTRPVSRINEVVPHVHPKDPDTLIVTDVVSYKSTDGGKTFVPFKGAPGGDDNQNIWWNPNDPNIMLLVVDQGAVVTLNGGQTLELVVHAADRGALSRDGRQCLSVPGMRRTAGQRVRVRGEPGQRRTDHIPRLASGRRRRIRIRGARSARSRSGVRRQGDEIRPPHRSGIRCRPRSAGVDGVARLRWSAVYRTVRTQPVVFSTVDPRALFYGNNVLWKTTDGGINWKQISPDLTREKWDVPKNVGTYASRVQRRERGAIGAQVIYTIGPSYVDINRIWIGTDDGVIATTADGGLHWTDVTPPQLTSFMKVFIIDPGRFDPLTAYAAVNTLRLDDMNPHIYRTHDGGKTWKEIVNGIPGGAPVSVVREDPKRKGLLFAGSETQVYVSFDDGDHWQSLRLNMAPSSVRDLIIKDDDLVVGTHGRGIWILDDITPLRQIGLTNATTDADAILFKPQAAYRVRWNMNTDTPLPPDEPAAPNPPEGAIINYYLKSAAAGPVTLEILGGDGKLVRRYSSTDEAFKPDPATINIPLYWFRPLTPLSAAAGMHRFTWDMHYQPLDRRRPPRRAEPSDRGNRTQHRAGADDAVGQSRPVHGQAHGQRQELHAADRREAGSAREDARAGDATGVHAVEGDVLRRGRRAGGRAPGACAPRPDCRLASPRQWRRGRGAGGAGQEARVARTDATGAGGGAWSRRPRRWTRRRRACGTGGLAQRRERRTGWRDEPATGCRRPSDDRAAERDRECTNNGRHDDGEVGGHQGGRYGIDEYSIESGWTEPC